MTPIGEGKSAHYEAEGTWDLLGGYPTDGGKKRVPLVAGGGFEPPTFGL